MGENICNEATDKRLISKIYRQLMQLNTHTHTKNKTNQIKTWMEDLNRYFSKEDIQMVKKHVKKCSISLIIREMHIKTTMRNHLIIVRIVIINLQTINTRGMWRRENPFTLLVEM